MAGDELSRAEAEPTVRGCLYYYHVNSLIFTRQTMETYRYPIVLINYLNILCNLRNLWIKSLFGCGFVAIDASVTN